MLKPQWKGQILSFCCKHHTELLMILAVRKLGGQYSLEFDKNFFLTVYLNSITEQFP